MAVSSFLNEGAAIPQGSALTDMTKQTVMPEWYTNYAMDILSGQQAIANRPYATAPMPRVAGFTPLQEKSFGWRVPASPRRSHDCRAGCRKRAGRVERSAAVLDAGGSDIRGEHRFVHEPVQ